MRILDLSLVAFGPFTGITIDLSEGEYGLHIIHGSNEAGKSASLRGLTALFCGIPSRTPDNFLHDNQNLRLGARIRNSEGEELSFMRRKGNKDTLLDCNGKPMPESFLTRHLHGAPEDVFETMFAMDHESLIRGGEQVLRGGGAIGESLFAAGMGGTNLRQVLRSLEDEASELFLPKGKLQKINKALALYKEIKQTSSRVSLAGRDWAEHDAALKEAFIRKAKIDEELKVLESERNRLERLRKALPKVAARKGLMAKLDGLGIVKAVPASFGKRRRAALGKLEASRQKEREASEALQRIALKMEALVVPELLLQEAEAVAELHEQLGSHRKAYRDLPRLQGEKLQLSSAAESILRELGPDLSLEGVEALRITAGKRARIRELGGSHLLMEEKLRRSIREVGSLQLKLASKRDEQAALPAHRDPARLRGAIARAQKRGDLGEELKAALKGLGVVARDADLQLTKLGLWEGSLDAVETLPVPTPETIDRFDAAFGVIEKRVQLYSDRIEQHAGSMAEMERQINELRLGGQVPSEEELDAARRRRQVGWSLIRGSWLDGRQDPEAVLAFSPVDELYIAYEKSVQDADHLADRLRWEADRVAKHSALLTRLDKCRDDLEGCEGEKQIALDERENLQQGWRELWKPARVLPLTPKEMRSWLVRFEKLSGLARERRDAESRVEDIKERINEHRSELSKCLEELGESPAASDEALDILAGRCLIVAGAIEESDRKRRELHKAVLQLEEEISRAGQDKSDAENGLLAWNREWVQSTSALGVAESASPAEVNAVLDKIEELFKLVDKMTGLKNRINAIFRDGAKFEGAVREMAGRIAPDLAGLPVEQAAGELIARAKKAGEDAATLAELREQRVEYENSLGQARISAADGEMQLKELCDEASCADYGALEEIEERALLAQTIRKDIGAVESQLLDYSGGTTLEELIKEVDAADADSLPFGLAEVGDRIEGIEHERSELLQKIGSEKNQLDMMNGGSEAAEAAEKAQAIVAEIRESTERYMLLRLASRVLHKEIERYRAENQDPLLRRAGELFSRLTLGSFAGIQADFNDVDEPILLGVRPGGQRVTVEGMSEGTRDQLFLALRLASLEKYLAGNEPIPLVVDDILVNFDDARAKATLEVLDELSTKTQVVFFTHHTHLLDLAHKADSVKRCFVHFLTPEARAVHYSA